MNKTTSHGAWPLRVAALAAMLALGACGGGKDDEAGQPWMQPAAAPAAAESASAPRTTLAQYAIDRTQIDTVLGFPSPTGEEMESIHRDSVERGIAQLLRQMDYSNNVMALPSLQASLIEAVAAAARGATLAELRSAHPEETRLYARTVQTTGVNRSLWAPAGTPLNGSFLRATDLIAPLPPLASWQGAEVTSRDDARLVAALDGMSEGALAGLALGGDTRLLMVDRLQDKAAFAATPSVLPDGVFVSSDGARRVMPMLQWPAIRHERADHVAHLAIGPAHRHVVTIQPTSVSLSAFAASGALAKAVSELAQMSRQRTLVALPAGTLVLPALKGLAVYGYSTEARGLLLARSEYNANLSGLDGGGTYLRTADLPTQLSIGNDGLSVSGGHAAAFHFSPRNIYGTAGVFTSWDPSGVLVFNAEPPPICPRATADLRSLFVAVFDDNLRLVALAALGSPPGSACQ